MKPFSAKSSRTFIASWIVWPVAYMVGLFLLKKVEMPLAVGVAVAIVPALAFAWFVWNYIRAMRSMDEVERQIQLEAAVVAFALGLVLLMVLGLLGLVVELNPEDWSHRHLVPYFVIFYFVGLFRARRKYA